LTYPRAGKTGTRLSRARAIRLVRTGIEAAAGSGIAVRVREEDLAEAVQLTLDPAASQPVSDRLTGLGALFGRALLSLYRARVSAESQQARDQMIASGEILPTSEMTKALGISRQALNKALHEKRIFALEHGSTVYYPRFFSNPELERSKLEAVSKRLGDLNSWSKLQFFTTPKASLGKLTPLDALKSGDLEKVLNAAQAFAER
jgi:hypothetical protein